MNQKIRNDALFTCIVIFKEHTVINHTTEEPGIFDISAKGTGTPAHFIIDGIFSMQDYCSGKNRILILFSMSITFASLTGKIKNLKN